METYEIKERLHLPRLAVALGLDVQQNAIRCIDPAHNDGEPSMGFFVTTRLMPQHWRFKCQACGVQGDGIQFLRVFRQCDWPTALKEAERWATDPALSVPPAERKITHKARGAMRRTVRESWENAGRARAVAGELFSRKDLDIDPAWAVEHFRLGAAWRWDTWRLVMPYLRVAGGQTRVVGATWRAPNDEARTIKGSRRTDILYAEWRDTGQPWVVLCEGETDTLYVAWLMRKRRDVLVLGVPGASAKPTMRTAALIARRVVIVPDADKAGSAMRRTWGEAAHHAGATSVHVARLPRGADACAAGRMRVLSALHSAMT